jgi:hypothetical protein
MSDPRPWHGLFGLSWTGFFRDWPAEALVRCLKEEKPSVSGE